MLFSRQHECARKKKERKIKKEERVWMEKLKKMK